MGLVFSIIFIKAHFCLEFKDKTLMFQCACHYYLSIIFRIVRSKFYDRASGLFTMLHHNLPRKNLA